MRPVDRIGRAFSPWAVALSAPRALPWAGIGARRWRLRPSAGRGFLGSVTTSAFSQTDPLPTITGWGFQPLAVALSAPRALPWAGIGARRWRLRPSAPCRFLGSVTTSASSQTDPLPFYQVK